MFGLSGIFGKLAGSAPLMITFGRGAFAVAILLLVALLLPRSGDARTGVAAWVSPLEGCCSARTG